MWLSIGSLFRLMGMDCSFQLMIVGERSLFQTTAEWLQKLVELVELISLYPAVRLQVRAKGKHSFGQRQQALELVGDHPQVILNGSLDEAKQLSWMRVHVPEKQMIRADPKLSYGASVHSVKAALQAQTLGAQYLQFGAVFAPFSKPGKGRGLAALQEICQHSTVPVFAVGGIDLKQVASCRQAGAAGVACATTVMLAKEPQKVIQDLLQEFAN